MNAKPPTFPLPDTTEQAVTQAGQMLAWAKGNLPEVGAATAFAAGLPEREQLLLILAALIRTRTDYAAQLELHLRHASEQNTTGLRHIPVMGTANSSERRSPGDTPGLT